MHRAQARAKQAKEQLETANIKLREEIDERKRVEKELSSQTRILKSVLTSIGEGVVVADLNGKFTIWNPAAEQIIQLGPVDVPPEQWTKQYGVYLPDQVTPYPADQLPLARAIRGESMDGDEQFLRHAKAPQGIWLSVTGRPLRDESGVLRGGVVAITDITERKRGEERFRIVVESAPYAMIMVNQAGGIVLVNSQAERVFGYTREELMGQSIERLVPERFRNKHPEHRKGFFRDPRTRAMGAGRDLFGLRKDGREIPIEIGLSPLATPEGPCVLAAITDITVRKQTEEQIKQLNEDLKHRSVELEMVNKELEAFSYSVSHDLRTPLRGIDGFSKILLEDFRDKLDAHGQDALRRVRAATQRMAQLIDDLLNLSRVSRSEMRREPVDLSAMVRAITEEIRKPEPDRQVEFIIAPSVVANGDQRLLRVALENLLANAWKFTSKHPRARIEFGVMEQEGRPVYFIRDDGAGFEMTYAHKLFGAFQRLHSLSEFPGTGIGLATVQRVIHRHDGRAWAEGSTENGATFYFTL
jgi:PAS domain S-box-containing protein